VLGFMKMERIRNPLGFIRLSYTLLGYIRLRCIQKGFMKLINPFVGFSILRLFFTV
jgi:hypothetical protein